MTRHEAREQAFAVIFEKLFKDDISFADIIADAEESGLVKVNNFANSILKLVEDNIEKIDEVISANLVNWTIQRLPKVSVAVLRLAVAEILFSEEVPAGVAVNEAVEIAKTFGTVEDASYINGVLSTIVKGLNK